MAMAKKSLPSCILKGFPWVQRRPGTLHAVFRRVVRREVRRRGQERGQERGQAATFDHVLSSTWLYKALLSREEDLHWECNSNQSAIFSCRSQLEQTHWIVGAFKCFGGTSWLAGDSAGVPTAARREGSDNDVIDRTAELEQYEARKNNTTNAKTFFVVALKTFFKFFYSWNFTSF